MRAFCKREGVPLDFVNTHHYPTDAALGWDWDMTPHMAKSPRGVLREMTAKVHAEAGPFPLYYTEWNCSAGARTPWQDEPYLAAFAIKTLADNQGLVEGYSYWTFSDLFEEMPLPSMPFHGSFGLLTIHGVPKPVYRAFELLHRAGEERLAVTGERAAGEHPTVEVLATKRTDGVQVIVINHKVQLVPLAEEEVTVVLTGVEAASHATVTRIDETHANAKRRWQELGSPEYPDAGTIEELKRASQFVPEEVVGRPVDGGVAYTFRIRPHGVVALNA